jgi:PEGA domain
LTERLIGPRRGIFAGVLAGVFALSLAPPVGAQSAPPQPPQPPHKLDLAGAKRHFDDGQGKFKDRDFAGALADFQFANDVKATPQAELYIARCLDALGRLQSATEWYERFLAHVPSKMAVHGEWARKRNAKIKNTPGTLHVESNPPGAAIVVDGNRENASTPADVELAPGRHTILLAEPGRMPAEKSIDIAFASTQTVSADLPVEPSSRSSPGAAIAPPRPVAAATPPLADPPAATRAPADTPAAAEEAPAVEDPPAPEEPPVQRPTIPLRVYLTGGAAVIAAGVGTVFGMAALRDKNDFDHQPTPQNADKRNQDALIADVAFGVALASGVATAVLFLTANQGPSSSGSGAPPPTVSVRGAGKTAAITITPTPLVGPHGPGAGFVLRF